jgi:hypothetical protein
MIREKHVVIWNRDEGIDEELEGSTGSWTTKQWVALDARGRQIMICYAFKKQFLISRVVKVKKEGCAYRLYHEPYRRISATRSLRYWNYMRRKMSYGGARIMRLPKGLLGK